MGGGGGGSLDSCTEIGSCASLGGSLTLTLTSGSGVGLNAFVISAYVVENCKATASAVLIRDFVRVGGGPRRSAGGGGGGGAL